MLVKSYDLNGIALDYAVAKAKNHQYRCPWMLEQDGYKAWKSYERAWGNFHPNYSEDSTFTSCFMEELKISVMHVEEDDPFPIEDGPWTAAVPNSDYGYTGPTALIAICRCYVSYKLGEDIEIPNELFKE